MAKITYINKPRTRDCDKYNTSRADLEADEFVILANRPLRAFQAIAEDALGPFEDLTGRVAHVGTFNVDEDDFASANLDVYYDPANKKFSSEETPGYYRVGTNVEPISDGILKVDFEKPELIPEPLVKADISDLDELKLADLADVNMAGITNNDTLKYDAASHKMVVVAAAD